MDFQSCDYPMRKRVASRRAMLCEIKMHYEAMGRTIFIAVMLLLVSCLRTVAEPQIEDKGTAVTPQRVILYDEDQYDPKGRRYTGSAVWHTETVSPAPGMAAELTARADIEIPERHMHITWSLRRNTDRSLPATHTIEVIFKLGMDFAERGIDNVPGVLMKSTEHERGVPLAGLSVKVTDNYFLIGLSAKTADTRRNMQLLRERDWLDIPIVYTNGKRAILAIQKGEPGKNAFVEVLDGAAPNRPANSKANVISQSVAHQPTPLQVADEGAPLGLTWGNSVEQLRAQGIELKPFPQKEFGETFLASKLPRALGDQETAALAFGFDDKLFRVAIISRSFENDPYGIAVRSRYSELLTILSEKYGQPQVIQSLGGSIYKEPQYFLAGINAGQSNWYANYETPRLFIQLALVADSSSSARWRIIFEEKDLKKAFDAARKAKEKGAL